jgi:GNAT superfamily N-acetyltransferase
MPFSATARGDEVGTAQPRVRKATAADLPRLVETLAEAFDQDPPMQWFFPDPERRMAQVRRQFTLFISKVHLPNGESYTTDEVSGGALWIPPDGYPVPTFTQLKLIPALIRIYGRRFGHALRGVKAMETNHPRTPHFYLDTLGVERAMQGRGIGSALMRPVLARCDREKVPAFLNAGSPRSRDLYLRHGFEVTEVFELPDGGPPLWRMWREPAQP